MKLPDTWLFVTLEEIGSIVSGGTPSTKEPSYWGGNINWISPSDLTGYTNKFIRNGAKSITDEGLKNSSAVVMPAGSVHFSSRAPIGYTAISTSNIATNQGFKSLVPAKGIFNEYVYYYFKSAKQLAESRATGTTFKEISGSAFSKLPIPLPPTNEQHRIVAKIEALFSELDKGIESFKIAREQLKIYRQALLKHAFFGKLTEQWRAENQGKLESAEALLQRIQTERQQRYRQQLEDWESLSKSPPAPLFQRGEQAANRPADPSATTIPPFEKGGLGGISKPKAPKTLPPLTAEELAELPELPEGWVYSRLGALIDEPTYGTSKKCDYEVDGIGVLRIPNVVSGRIDVSDLKFAQFDEDEIASYKLDDGDILLIRSNGSISIVGKCALVSEQDAKYLYAGYLIKLRPNQVLIASTYLLNQLSTHSLRKQIEAKAKSTSGVNNINSGEIQSLIIALCSVEEQQKVLTVVETNLSIIDQLDQTLTTALQQAEALRQSILKKAFSGQLVPQDPNDEPASVLLERIRAEKAAQDQPKSRRNKHA